MSDDPAAEEAIRLLLSRLARPHPSGGEVVERATLLAEGAEFPAIMAWIDSHEGIPESTLAAAPRRGLHGSRTDDRSATRASTPLRYVLPVGALDALPVAPTG